MFLIYPIPPINKLVVLILKKKIVQYLINFVYLAFKNQTLQILVTYQVFFTSQHTIG